MNSYDEIKVLLKRSRAMLNEQIDMPKHDVPDSIEKRIDSDTEGERKEGGKKQGYKINGDIIILHGDQQKQIELTTIEKKAFSDTVREFNDEVSDLVEFDELNLYNKSVEWSGKMTAHDLQFVYVVGENDGVYINCDLFKLDDETYDVLNKLKTYFDKFSSKWGDVINSRKELE